MCLLLLSKILIRLKNIFAINIAVIWHKIAVTRLLQSCAKPSNLVYIWKLWRCKQFELFLIADKTVGFRLGAYKGGQLNVVEPLFCKHIPETMKKLIQVIQCFNSLRTSDT